MNCNQFRIRLLTILLISIFSVLTSCNKDDQGHLNKYLVSDSQTGSFTMSYIGSLLEGAASFEPAFLELKSQVTTDINIYKIVYKTIIDSVEINASGLVCVPSTPGDYPVLSFQNGTNTLNANAPSVSILNYSYQLVEIIASMGYIVVIADYPGFGESAGIPHPYLVAEPTVRSLIDMLYAVREFAESELPGITQKNEYYLIGYSQGGWATLALHKSMELDFNNDFNLAGSACGAGPYDISLLFNQMIHAPEYPMPVYPGYILNAYKSYDQFSNPVSDIINEPYSSRLSSLYNGLLSSDEINARLTTSIPDLLNAGFISGITSSPEYASVRFAMIRNSIMPWHGQKPLLFMHGEKDTHVSPISTENMYSTMIQAGTSTDICKKIIIPDADHGEGVVPFMVQGIKFLNDLKTSK